MVSGCNIIHGISDKEVKKMKAKRFLAVGAAGVSLFGASALLASVSNHSVVYADQAPDGQFTNGTVMKYLNGKYGYADFNFQNGYVATPGSIPGYTYVRSGRDGHNWVHYFISNSDAAAMNNGANSGSQGNSSTTTSTNTGTQGNSSTTTSTNTGTQGNSSAANTQKMSING